MISCFAVLVSFAVFAGFQDVKSIHVQKHQPQILHDSDGTNQISGYNNDMKGRKREYNNDQCAIQVVESIPDILKYPPGSIKSNSTYHAWNQVRSTASAFPEF